ncbi:MAG: lipid-transfer protein [Acidimicrobiia bacterium]
MTDETAHRDRCAIVGIGATEFSRDSGRSTLALAAEASLAAIQDAGLGAHEIDGIIRCDLDEVLTNDLGATLGLKNLTHWSTVSTGGTAPAAMVGHAVAAIVAGLASTVLVFRSLNGRSGGRLNGSAAPTATLASYEEFTAPYGLVAPGSYFALLADRHMHEFGTSPEQLGSIAIACRNRANANPAAQMFGRPLSLEQYLSGRMLSAPLRLFDYCLETDGACAVVVTSTGRARDCARPPALIRAVAQATGPNIGMGNMFPHLFRPDAIALPSAATALELYRRAGLGPSDIDVAQFYDCFTITALLQLEDYGFCARGEGGPFAESGAIEMGGDLPINTSGGHLSEGYIHGMNHIVEGVRQIRGESTSQVPQAETALVTSAPVGASALILRTDR